MPLLYKVVDNRYCAPLFICDYCDEQITDTLMANALWDMGTDMEGSEVYFCHNHCTHPFETHAMKNTHLGANGLDLFLVYLINNVEWDRAKSERLAKQVDMIGV